MKIAFDGATERQSARVLVLMSELGSSKLFSRLWWRVPGILHGEKSRTRNALNSGVRSASLLEPALKESLQIPGCQIPSLHTRDHACKSSVHMMYWRIDRPQARHPHKGQTHQPFHYPLSLPLITRLRHSAFQPTKALKKHNPFIHPYDLDYGTLPSNPKLKL